MRAAARIGHDGHPAAQCLDAIPPGEERKSRAAVGFHVECEPTLFDAYADRRSRVVVDAFEDFETTEVDRAGDLLRTARSGIDLDASPNPDADCRCTQGRRQPTRLQERRIDPVGQRCRLLQRLLYVTAHVVEERLGRVGVVSNQLARELKVDRERDQVLLRAVVELALDSASRDVVGGGEAFARGA